MPKTNVILIIALALAMLASLALDQVNTASAQGPYPVGVVVSYTPEQSITIVDQQGAQHEYLLSSSLMILPPGSADSLAIGSFITVIAAPSSENGTPTAIAIVVHPSVPPGWNVPSMTETPVATPTAMETSTSNPTETPMETPTPIEIPTSGMTETATPTPPAAETLTATPPSSETPTPTPTGGGTTITTNALIEWLRSLFRQLLTSS